MEVSTLHTGWGWLALATTRRGLRALTLPKNAEQDALAQLYSELGGPATERGEAPQEICAQLLSYFSGRVIAFHVPLDLPDRPRFWRLVWDAVAAIPYGAIASYGEVARRAGVPKAARAVGGAMAHNPVPLVVPCHRVLGGDGRLTGFGGGLDLKRRLLEMEQEAIRQAPN